MSICALVGILAAKTLSTYTEASMPYLDALTTSFSIFTTLMVARKYLENWFYWIAIDGVSIYLYASQELYLTMGLFVIFTIMAIAGAWNWTRRYARTAPSP